jgi:hypothetical protein
LAKLNNILLPREVVSFLNDVQATVPDAMGSIHAEWENARAGRPRYVMVFTGLAHQQVTVTYRPKTYLHSVPPDLHPCWEVQLFPTGRRYIVTRREILSLEHLMPRLLRVDPAQAQRALEARFSFYES